MDVTNIVDMVDLVVATSTLSSLLFLVSQTSSGFDFSLFAFPLVELPPSAKEAQDYQEGFFCNFFL